MHPTLNNDYFKFNTCYVTQPMFHLNSKYLKKPHVILLTTYEYEAIFYVYTLKNLLRQYWIYVYSHADHDEFDSLSNLDHFFTPTINIDSILNSQLSQTIFISNCLFVLFPCGNLLAGFKKNFFNYSMTATTNSLVFLHNFYIQ